MCFMLEALPEATCLHWELPLRQGTHANVSDSDSLKVTVSYEEHISLNTTGHFHLTHKSYH